MTQSKRIHLTAHLSGLIFALCLGLLSTAVSAGNILYRAQLEEVGDRFVPPAVLVGFDPQPEPPAGLLMAGDLSSANPRVVFTGIEGDSLPMLLGLGGGQQRLARLTFLGSNCGTIRSFAVWPLFREVVVPESCEGSFRLAARFTDRSTLYLDVTISMSQGDLVMPPGRLVGFDPQPEPPAVPSFGLRVDGLAEMDADTVTVDIRLTDEFGRSISLRLSSR
ncbi:MAG: hypothetical protein AAGJ52_12025 [Pseudomonadota bacterium]